MSSFTTALILKDTETELWEVHENFQYHVGSEDSLDYITVPAGFQTDLATIPRIFWSILPRDGIWRRAAVVHDWLCHTRERSQKETSEIFLEALAVCNVDFFTRRTMYYAVLWFGPKW